MDKDHGSTNIQDDYLARARKDRAWLTVVLNSGKKVVGRIRSFDRYTLPIRFDGAGKSKDAPSTAAPAVPDGAVIAADPGPRTDD